MSMSLIDLPLPSTVSGLVWKVQLVGSLALSIFAGCCCSCCCFCCCSSCCCCCCCCCCCKLSEVTFIPKNLSGYAQINWSGSMSWTRDAVELYRHCTQEVMERVRGSKSDEDEEKGRIRKERAEVSTKNWAWIHWSRWVTVAMVVIWFKVRMGWEEKQELVQKG